nr:thioredoxin [uncultured bacterium]|tara:strand:+ start:5501 stop:5821 length:321 start_codon:yes stop_codon:yes gene_type:complete
MAIEINDSNFEETVLKSDKPVMVDFWAAWCGPCRMVGPIMDELSSEFQGRAVVGKVDIDSNQQYAAKFGIRNIPTVLIFKNGELVERKVGVLSKIDYSKLLDELVQ